MDTQIIMLKRQYSEEIKELKERMAAANKDKQRYKDLFEKSESELAGLVNVDKRMEKMDDLKDSYT